MRPINLIPEEERRERVSEQGKLAYVVVAVLIAVLAGVILLVLTSNQISERKGEVASLQQENAAAEAKAARLVAYRNFDEVRNQRVAAVTSLANSRFAWERVLRELSLTIPQGVRLTLLTGSASPELASEGGGGIALRGAAKGPALELVGCAPGQQAVAGFVSLLKNIDGVTRVGVQSSELTAGQTSGESPITDSGGSDECLADEAKFEIVAAFDAAPIPAAASEAGAEVTVAGTEASSEAPATGSTEATPAPEPSAGAPTGE
jgi:Tfp pilus assembly protein PilN